MLNAALGTDSGASKWAARPRGRVWGFEIHGHFSSRENMRVFPCLYFGWMRHMEMMGGPPPEAMITGGGIQQSAGFV